MDRYELKLIGEKLRRQTTNGSLLKYLDGTLPLLKVELTPEEQLALSGEGAPVLVSPPLDASLCPACMSRRAAKAAAQKRYRAKQKTP